MEKQFTLQSKVDGLTLYGWCIEPTCAPKGIVQILHGKSEFKERYEEFMRSFVEQGYVAVCHDHRGHGDSVRDAEDLGHFYDKTGKAVVSDSVQVTEYIREQYPNLPIVLFGHSMGSMIARCYLQEHDDLVDKVILCGSPSENPLCGVGIFLARFISVLRGAKHRSPMLAYLSTGKGDDRFPGEGPGAWLSRDRANIEKFQSNPKRKKNFTCNGFENLFRLMKMTYQKEKYLVHKSGLPIHFVSGGDDAVLGSEEKWMASIECLREVGYTQVTGKLYEGMRHEVFNEIGKEEVFADLLTFIEKA